MKCSGLVVLLGALAVYAGPVKTFETQGFDEIQVAYESFMDSNFPRPEKQPGFVRQHGPVITIMITGEFALETQLSLYREENAVVVEITRAVGASVYEQLYDIHSKSSNQKEGAPQDDVVLQKMKVSSLRCPDLEQLFEAFENLEVSAFVDSTLFFPSVTYQIWVTGLVEENYFKIIGPAVQADRVVYWGKTESIRGNLVAWIHELVLLLQVGPVPPPIAKQDPTKQPSEGCRPTVD